MASRETEFTAEGWPEGFWQTRQIKFEGDTWSDLLPDDGVVTGITQQFRGEIIAIVWGEDEADQKASANLLAAAPDLYEALVEAAGVLRDFIPEGHGIHPNPQYEVIDKARAALAKARGEGQ